jgi:hypothetical protein
MTDLLRVFLGLSSSVFTLETSILLLGDYSLSGGGGGRTIITSFSQFFSEILYQVLLWTISFKSLERSICFEFIYSTNLLKPTILSLGTKLNRSSLTSATWLHFKILNSWLYKDRIVSSLRSSGVIPDSRILRYILEIRFFSLVISSLSNASKLKKYLFKA